MIVVYGLFRFLVLMSIPFWVDTPKGDHALTFWAIRLVMLGAVGGAIRRVVGSSVGDQEGR